MTTADQAATRTSPPPGDALIEQGDSPIVEADFVLGGGLRQVTEGETRVAAGLVFFFLSRT